MEKDFVFILVYLFHRAMALHICRGLLDLGWIEPLDGEQDFKDDFALYIPGPVSMSVFFLLLPNSLPRNI